MINWNCLSNLIEVLQWYDTVVEEIADYLSQKIRLFVYLSNFAVVQLEIDLSEFNFLVVLFKWTHFY